MTLIKKRFPGFTNLSDFFDDDWFARFNRADWMPAVNVCEENNNYIIELAVPGMERDNFHIDLEGNILTVKGEVKEEQKEEKKNYTRREFSFRSFTRSFTLPEDVDKDHIKAKYDNGVLKLHLTRMAIEQPKAKEVAVE